MEAEMNVPPVDEDIRARNRRQMPASSPPMASSIPPRKPKPKPTIREAYERYKAGKGFGRSDLFLVMVEAIEELQGRIGSVDEKAVSDIGARVGSLEMTIGNALAQQAAAGMASPRTGAPAKKRGRPKIKKVESDADFMPVEMKGQVDV